MASIMEETSLEKANRIAKQAAGKIAGKKPDGLYGPTTLSSTTPQEVLEGKSRLNEYQSRPGVVAQNLIKESPYVKTFTGESEGERQQAFAEVLPDLIPGTIAFDLVNKATKALVGGVKSLGTGTLYSKPGDGKAKPLSGETTLSMPTEKAPKLGLFARAFMQGWAGDAPITEDEGVNTLLDVVVPVLFFGGVPKLQDVAKFKNVAITGPEIKNAFSQITSGVDSGAKPEALEYASNLLKLGGEGKDIMSAIKTGANVKVKRDYLSWVKKIIGLNPEAQEKEIVVKGLLGDLKTTDPMTAPDKVIDDLYTEAKKVYDPVQVGEEVKPAIAEGVKAQMTQEGATNALIRFGSKIDENGGQWTDALKKEYQDLVKVADGQEVSVPKTPEVIPPSGDGATATTLPPEASSSALDFLPPEERIASMPETATSTKPIKVPEKVFNSEKGAEVFTELQTSAAGARIATEEGTIGVSSSFPDWVPSRLRLRPIFDDVEKHLLQGTMPKGERALELYNLVHQRMLGGSNVPQVEAGVSKVGTSIAQKAIEDKLTKAFGGTAEYDKITIEDQSKRASDIVNNDIDRALRILHADESLPEGLRGASVITALEDYAVKTQNVELLQDIARSPLTSETSVHAQEMRLLAERDPDSPIGAMGQIKTARTQALEKKLPKGETAAKAKSDIVKSIKNEIKMARPPKEDWASFVDSLTC